MKEHFLYKKLYYILFNAVTDAIQQPEQFDAVECRKILMEAQKKCEELYISAIDEADS